MRRSVVVLAALGLLVSVTGVAVAANVTCDGGPCEGTDRPDNIAGSNERDLIFAFGNRDRVDGREGNDDLHGGDGPDDLCGQEGADDYGGSTQGDVLAEDESCLEGIFVAGNGASGPDEMSGGRGADLLAGDSGADELRGNDGADILGSGESFTPSLIAGEGNDLVGGGERGDGIVGQEGDDRLLGGQGHDFIDAEVDESKNGEDFVDCGRGFDEAVANQNDEVVNCERVRREDPTATAGSSSELVQRAIEAFRAERSE
jgi:Ca2+-binding RTX toxin-like protein